MNPISNLVDKKLGKNPVSQGSAEPRQSETETMRAVTWQGKRKMEVQTVPKPLVTHPEDAIIKVTAMTICSGSDSHLYASEIPNIHHGQIVGHEAMGVVESVGDGVQNIKVGQRCVISFSVACGKCEQCQKQNFTACETTNDSKLAEKMYGHSPSGLFGYGNLLGGIWGSQAEYVRVPFADTNCFPVPDDVPDEKALYLSDVLGTSLHGTVLAEVKEGDTVAIWGLGPIGLCTARWCQIKGASKIVGIDMVPERLALAKNALGIEVLDRTGFSSEEVCNKLLELEPSGFDAVIECVGFRFAMSTKHKVQRAIGLETDTPEIIHEALKCMKGYGHLAIIGDYAFLANSFPIGLIMFKHATVRSGQAPVQRYFKEIMDAVQKGTFDPTFIITNKIKIEDVPFAYEKLFQKEDGWIKVFVDMK